MQRVIKDGQIVDDNWHLVPALTTIDQISTTGDLIVSLPMWQEHKSLLNNREGKTAVWLAVDEEIEELSNDLPVLPLIALDFPIFTNGRHYSSARILRERYNYQGEIRAIGDVLKDQLFAMQRCGFNVFAVRADKNIEIAILGLQDFSMVYQGASDDPLPLFRRR